MKKKNLILITTMFVPLNSCMTFIVKVMMMAIITVIINNKNRNKIGSS